MCLESIFPGLFGGKPEPTVINKAAPAAAPVASAATREKRTAGVVKTEAGDLAKKVQPVQVSGGGNQSIGIGIGTPDSPRKRTNELGL
jgi:hypothetical protein